MIKRSILVALNIFFVFLFVYAVHLFLESKKFDADVLVQNTALKGKTFDSNVKEIVLESGIKALFLEEKTAPIVALKFCFAKAGYAFDAVGKQGLASMAADIIDDGAGAFDKQTYYDILEQNAIALDFSVSHDSFVFSMTFPTQNMKTAMEVLKAVLYHPHVKQKDLDIVRFQQLEALKMRLEKPGQVLNIRFKKILYGDHPLAWDALGTKEDIEKITPKDIKDFFRSRFVKENLYVAVAGDITLLQAKELLGDIFYDLTSSENEMELEDVHANYRFEEQNVVRNMPQVIAHFVAEGVERLDADFYPLYIANEVFGGAGLNSRLNKRAREKEGLTYGVNTYLEPSKKAPRIEGNFATSKENYAKMRQILLEEWQAMADFGVKKEEFEAVKNNMLTSFNLRFTSLSDITSQLLYMQKKNLGLDFLQKRNEYVQNVTLSEVNAAAHKYFKVPPSIVTIGNNE